MPPNLSISIVILRYGLEEDRNFKFFRENLYRIIHLITLSDMESEFLT